jgi:hypothetical protein
MVMATLTRQPADVNWAVRAAAGEGGAPGGPVVPRRNGLSFAPGVRFDTWRRIGCELGAVSDSSSWWLGDWLVFGERHYPDRYRVAVAGCSLEYKTLRNYAWIARRVPLRRRRERLSMSHHAEVAGLSEHEQEMWLERADRGRWSRNRLRREIQMAGTPVPQEPGPARPAGQVVQIRISPEERTRWASAALATNQDLTTWIKNVLDRATSPEPARQAPSPSGG